MTTVPSSELLPHGAHVLLVRLSALGDVLFALETVAALKDARPDVRIDFLVEDRFADLLTDHPQLDRVIRTPRRSVFGAIRSALALRQRRYDVVIDLHGILKSALQVACTRAGRTIGFRPPVSREGAHLLYDIAVALPESQGRLPHRAEQGHHVLHTLGLPVRRTAPSLGAIAPPGGLLLNLASPRVLLHPGTSSFAAFKRWPLERFTGLAGRLIARGCGVAVSFGPGERDLIAPLLAAQPQVLPIDGKALGLRGLAGVCREMDVVVAADTGPLHLAAAVGTACVALFGPKDERRYGPRAHGRAHEILFHDVPCRPCRLRDCPSPQCVLGIGVDEVEAAVLRAVQVPA